MSRAFPFIVPIIVIAIVAAGIIGIGELLLAVGIDVAVPLALCLALGTGAVCMGLSFRASKLPPVQLPEAREAGPARRLDLGAGYLVGQFIGIFGIMLFLLFLVLALKHH